MLPARQSRILSSVNFVIDQQREALFFSTRILSLYLLNGTIHASVGSFRISPCHISFTWLPFVQVGVSFLSAPGVGLQVVKTGLMKLVKVWRWERGGKSSDCVGGNT
jgi:hypothetical protein